MGIAVSTPNLSATGALKVTFSRNLTVFSIVAADFIAMLAACSVAVLLQRLTTGPAPLSNLVALLAAVCVSPLVFFAVGMYPGIALNPVEEFRRTFYGMSLTFGITLSGTFFMDHSHQYSRLIMVVAWSLSGSAVVLSRLLTRKLCSTQPWWGVPTVILGSGETGRQMLAKLCADTGHGLRPVAILDDGEHSAVGNLAEGIHRGHLSLAPMFARAGQAYAIIAMPELPSQSLTEVALEHTGDFGHVLVIPDVFGVSSLGVAAKEVGGMLGLEVSQRLTHKLPQLLKRSFDIVLSIFILLSIAPFLAAIALLVALSSPGPVFYGQRRIGRNNRNFTVWKFRSMVSNADEVLARHLAEDPSLRAEWGRDHKLRRDPRVTAIGRFLRKTSFDELPQLWNVFHGDMSLVGPRPIVSAEVAKYGDRYGAYSKVRPGITGLWQISGRNHTTYDERTSLDEYYVRNWSIWLDLYILFKTVKTVAFREGAY